MDLQLLKKEITRHEGCEYVTYKDTLGYLTGGKGHLLSQQECAKFPLGTKLSEEQIDLWFEADILSAIRTAHKIYGPGYNSLDPVRQRVIVNLAFNLGNKLAQFKNTLAHFRNNNWELAARGLENSLWYKQVGRRGPEICHAVRTGAW
jgi:lysozyme